MSNVEHDSGSRQTQQEVPQPNLDHIDLKGKTFPKKNTSTRSEIRVTGTPSDTSTLPQETQKEIERLITDLGADSFGTRQRASRKLSDMGGAALPSLSEALKSDDPEVAERACMIIKNLPLTCKARGKASEICARLSKANGATIHFAGADGNVVLNIEQGSLSEILNEICAQTDNVYHISQRGDAEITEAAPEPAQVGRAIQAIMAAQQMRFFQKALQQGGNPVPEMDKNDEHGGE